MTGKQALSPDFALLPLIVLILVRWCLGGPPIFRSEFLIEDFILLLALACFVVPLRFKRLIDLVISCLVSTTMILIWTPKSGTFPVVVFALLAIYNAVRALIELSKLREGGLDGFRPQ